MNQSIARGWPAFLAVAVAVLAVTALMDLQGVVVPSWARMLLAFGGASLAILAGVLLAHRRSGQH